MHAQAAALFAPETVLPAQFFGAVRADTPERSMLLALLIDAVGLAVNDRGVTSASREARAWMESDTPEPFGFLHVCEHLDLDARRLRVALRTATRIKKPPHTGGSCTQLSQRVLDRGQRRDTSAFSPCWRPPSVEAEPEAVAV